VSAIFAILLAFGQADEASSTATFEHGIWKGICSFNPEAEDGKKQVCQAHTSGRIVLTFKRDAEEWTVSSRVEGCDTEQAIERIPSSSTRNILSIGDKAAAQILKSMVNTRLLSAMMSCGIKKYDNSMLNERDIVAIIASTNAADNLN